MATDEHNDIKIIMKAIICEDTTLRGDVTISAGCVIHPSATIIAESGPIVLGENCIVEEYASIINRNAGGTLTIGSNNVFEVGCTVEAYRIGDKNVFECKSFVGSRVGVSSGCIVGAGVRLDSAQDLQENTVIYGRDCLQREAIDKYSQTLQIEFLRKVLPNYHHLRKANYDPKRGRVAI